MPILLTYRYCCAHILLICTTLSHWKSFFYSDTTTYIQGIACRIREIRKRILTSCDDLKQEVWMKQDLRRTEELITTKGRGVPQCIRVLCVCTDMVRSQWLFTNGTPFWFWLDDVKGESVQYGQNIHFLGTPSCLGTRRSCSTSPALCRTSPGPTTWSLWTWTPRVQPTHRWKKIRHYHWWITI